MEAIESVFPGITEFELKNLLIAAKVRLGVREVKIKENFVDILFTYNKRRGEYLSPNQYKSLEMYAGCIVYVIEDGPDQVFIIDDNNYSICSSCFDEINNPS